MNDFLNFILVMISSGVMGILISCFYNLTHSRAVYSSRMTVLFVVLSITTAMLLVLKFNVGGVAVIGCAIIMRFRNPIKDHRDIVYVLLAIISGFSCATHMYPALGIAIIFLVIIMGIFNATQKSERVIMVVKGDGKSEEAIISNLMDINSYNFKMLVNNSVEEIGTELIYEISNCDNPYEVACDTKRQLYDLEDISEVHIMYQDDDMSI